MSIKKLIEKHLIFGIKREQHEFLIGLFKKKGLFMTKEDLLIMKLHEIQKVNPELRDVVIRVLGGWIYLFIRDTMTSSCFVPEEITIPVKYQPLT